jgi:CheY-like chemotaxis protein
MMGIMRVLVIEDDSELADAIATGLRQEQLAVDVANDGTAGLDRALLTDYDVIVLDRDLPGRHGDDVCAELHAAVRRPVPRLRRGTAGDHIPAGGAAAAFVAIAVYAQPRRRPDRRQRIRLTSARSRRKPWRRWQPARRDIAREPGRRRLPPGPELPSRRGQRHRPAVRRGRLLQRPLGIVPRDQVSQHQLPRSRLRRVLPSFPP